jgi:mannose/cellobiose epimerase-like protein (N-acyl-D-glucosamine 2-epimerase family)
MRARKAMTPESRRASAQPRSKATPPLRNWAIETALPFWAGAGVDAQRGGFHERLQLDGTPDRACPRRTRVQARQIYVYAHAAALGWYPEGTGVALHALEFMLAKCRAPDGAPGYVHRLAADNSVLDPLRDTYDHAFVLLALAWLARASGDAQVRALIDEVLAFMDERLSASDGTLLEGCLPLFDQKPPPEPRRQNPHMHAYESMLALQETIAHPLAPARAQALRNLLETNFLDQRTGTIGEYFTDDWRRWPDARGELAEPGHHAEWSWLLRRHQRLCGVEAEPLADHLLKVARRAADPATGFIADEVDCTGAIRKASRRCWPQTELAKALLAAAEAGSPRAADQAADVLRGIEAHYLAGPFPGGWIDQFDAFGRRLADTVPASTFYHLFGAIAEADRVLEPI